jgi:CO/xanthine dehydrogenase FAD-binding subunit
MIPVKEYIAPKNLDDALHQLHQKKGEAKIISGGTDILPGFHQDSKRFSGIRTLLDIKSIEELKSIYVEKDNIVIGPGVTFTEIIKNKIINRHLPLLVKAARGIGSMQIRNRASIGGNFINNAPCADSVPPLLIYNATLRIESFSNVQELPIKDFLLRPYKTQLKPEEIVTQIKIPIPSKNYKGDFYKLGRRRGVAISRITLVVLVEKENSTIKEIRIAGGAVTPIGIRFERLESFAARKAANSELFKQLAMMLGEEILDVTGLRWSTEYKLPVVQQMFYQLLEKINC